MAFIGLRKPYISKASIAAGTGVISYESSLTAFGKAVSFNDTPNVVEANLYGDDELAESEKAVTSATLSLGTTDIPDTCQEKMFGHTPTSSVYAYNIDDEANYCGFAIIGVKKVSGSRSYEAKFYPKTQWKEPTVDYQTRGESTQFTTPSTEGLALPDKDGVYKYEETFETESAALTWINSKFGISG
jgi:phi13 family phage major tail protein